MRIFFACLLLFLAIGPAYAQLPSIALPTVETPSQSIYIATDGSDSGGDGSEASPVATFSKALSLVLPGTVAGEHVYAEIVFKSGTYTLSDILRQPCSHYYHSSSGTYRNVSVRGEGAVVLDASQLASGVASGQTLLSLLGSRIYVRNITLKGSDGTNTALLAHGMSFNSSVSPCSASRSNNIWIDNVTVQGMYQHAAQISYVDTLLVENSTFFNNCLINKEEASPDGWPSGLKARLSTHATFRNNLVYENWGEGIILNRSSHVQAYNNTSHDNYSHNIYVDNGAHALVYGNLTYNSLTDNTFWRNSQYAASGVCIGTEYYTSDDWALLDSVFIFNNILLNSGRGFFWSIGRGTADPKATHGNIWFVHNTVVGVAGDASTAVVRTLDVSFRAMLDDEVFLGNGYIYNNVFSLDLALMAAPNMAEISNYAFDPLPTSIKYGYNSWNTDPRKYSSRYFPYDPTTDRIEGGIPAEGDEGDFDAINPNVSSYMLHTATPISLVGDDYYGEVRVADCNNVGAITASLPITRWNGSAWSAGAPTASHWAFIDGDYAMPAQADISCKSLTVSPGATLSMAGGQIALTGDWSNEGVFSATGGAVAFEGSAQQRVYGSSNFYGMSVNSGDTVWLMDEASVGGVLELQQGVLSSGGNLTLKAPNARIAYNGGAVSGRATAERYIPDAWLGYAGTGYRYLSSPFSDATLADISGFSPEISQSSAFNDNWNQPISPFPNVFAYNESRISSADASFVKGWEVPASSDLLKGFIVRMPAQQTVRLSGTLNSGDVAVGNIGRGAEATSGWQLLGNPYMAPISFPLFMADNSALLENACYIRIATSTYSGTWASFVNGVGSPSGAIDDGHIAPMQGFFVRRATEGSGGVATFKEAHALNGDDFNTFRKKEEKPLVRISVQANGHADEAVMYLQEGASASFDAPFDAHKVQFNASDWPTAYFEADHDLAINGVAPQTQLLPIGIYAPADGDVRIGASGNLGAAWHLLLEDKETGALIDMHAQGPYTFTATKGLHEGRFLWHLRKASITGIEGDAGGQPKVWGGQGTVFCTDAWRHAELYDISGRLLQTNNRPRQGQAIFRNLQQGVYLLQLYTADGVYKKAVPVH